MICSDFCSLVSLFCVLFSNHMSTSSIHKNNKYWIHQCWLFSSRSKPWPTRDRAWPGRNAQLVLWRNRPVTNPWPPVTSRDWIDVQKLVFCSSLGYLNLFREFAAFCSQGFWNHVCKGRTCFCYGSHGPVHGGICSGCHGSGCSRWSKSCLKHNCVHNTCGCRNLCSNHAGAVAPNTSCQVPDVHMTVDGHGSQFCPWKFRRSRSHIIPSLH